MSYPELIEVSLVEISGSSCGVVTQRMELDDNANPPEYNDIPGSGDLEYAKATRVDLGGGSYTWQIIVEYAKGTSCDGIHAFLRNQPADDPTGDFCIKDGSSTDCDLGKLISIETI